MRILLFEVYNFIYLLGIILIYRSICLHYRIFTGSSILPTQNRGNDWTILIIGLLLGTFFPVVTGFTIIILLGNLLGLWRKTPIKPKNDQNKYLKRIPKMVILWYWLGLILGFILIISIFIIYMIGIIGRWFSLDYYYPISVTLGILVALIQKPIIKSQILNKQINNIKIRLNKVRLMGLIFSILFLIANVGITLSMVPPQAPENNSDYHSTRFVTFNILNIMSNKFESANYWENRKINVANHLSILDPDIFGVQEAYYEQLQYINATLRNRIYNWSGLGRDDGMHAGEFSAIYYDMEKYSLLQEGTFWLSDTPDIPSRFPQDHNRICSWVHLKLLEDGSEFFIFNTHYGFSPELQIKASILLNARVVNMTGDLPVIIMGDFNMMNIYPFYLFMEGYGSKPLYEGYRLTHGYVNPLDATSAPTFKINTDVGFHIDQFFVSSDIIPISVKTIKQSYDGIHTYSDHYPVQMDCFIRSSN